MLEYCVGRWEGLIEVVADRLEGRQLIAEKELGREDKGAPLADLQAQGKGISLLGARKDLRIPRGSISVNRKGGSLIGHLLPGTPAW